MSEPIPGILSDADQTMRCAWCGLEPNSSLGTGMLAYGGKVFHPMCWPVVELGQRLAESGVAGPWTIEKIDYGKPWVTELWP